MASIVQSNRGGADGTPATATLGLTRNSTAGNTIVHAIAADKDAGGIPSGSYTPVDGRNSSSITLAVEIGVATGTREDTTWRGVGRPWAALGLEIDIPFASLSRDHDLEPTTEVAVASASVGPVTPPATGIALMIGAIDTITNWLSGTVASYRGSGGTFREVAYATTPLNDTGLWIAVADVTAGVPVDVTATGSSGGRDQVSLLLLALGAAVATTPRRMLLLGVG